MARYIMEEMPDIQKTGKRITYPKFARIDNASIKELARRWAMSAASVPET